MVPTSGLFSTPSSASCALPAASVPPSTTYATSGPLPRGVALQMPMFSPAQWPTPGAAYRPYDEPPPYEPSPQAVHLPHLDEESREVAVLTARLDAAMDYIQQLTHVVRGAPSSTPPPTMPYEPLAEMRVPTLGRPPPSPPSTHSSATFATITSSSRSTTPQPTERPFDASQLPTPAAHKVMPYSAAVTKIDDVFSSKELASMPCTCEPDAIAAWDVLYMGRLSSRSPAAHKVLLYTEAEIAAMPPAAKPTVYGYDVMLAGQILATLQGTTPRVKLMRANIASREKKSPGTVTGSGRALRAIILEVISPTCGSELERLEEDLERPFFTMGMDDTTVKLAAHRLEALRAQLPPSARGGIREQLRALLGKFPEELKKKAKKYKAEMCKAEVCQKPYEWSYSELVALLSSHITSSASEAEANAADLPQGGGGGGGGGGSIGTASFEGCLSCGLDGHPARRCRATPCEYCGLRFCFGIRKRGPKKGCLVKKLVEGGAIGPSDTGLNGRPITESPSLVARLKEKAEELKAVKPNESNTASVQTEKNVYTPEDDDDVCGGESD